MKLTTSLVLALGITSLSMAQSGSLDARVAALELSNAQLKSKVDDLQKQMGQAISSIVSLNGRVYELEQKTKHMSVSGNNVVFSGCNVQIKKDNGNYWAPNGLGNLIVGYNAKRTDGKSTVRTGSHNIVFGNENSYSGTMSLVGGFRNDVRGLYSAILSGQDNLLGTAYNNQPSMGVILTGHNNRTSGQFSLIGTGRYNLSAGLHTVVLTGRDNATNEFQWNGQTWIPFGSVVLTGDRNRARGDSSVTLTGQSNSTEGAFIGVGSGGDRLFKGVNYWLNFYN